MMATSASQYGSPYTYKEPPPKIKYPPMFSALNDITFRYILDSKILALSGLLLLVSWVICVAMTIMPFWFELVLGEADGTFGSMQVKPRTVINSGLFYLREDHWDNLAFLDSYNNEDVVPRVLAFAQVCAVFGHCIISCCLVATVILMFRQFTSVTGTTMLAAAATVGAVAECLTCVFCLLLVLQSTCEPPGDGCTYEDNLTWRMIPMYTQYYRVEPVLTPYVSANWAFYIAIFGALLCIASAVLLWMEALSTGRTLSGIRYEQLKNPIDPYENDINPTDGKRYVYAEPDRYGTGAWGMQPVIGVQYAPPAAVQYAPQPQQSYQPQQGYGHRPSVGFAEPSDRRGYSDSSFTESSVSERPVKQREINL